MKLTHWITAVDTHTDGEPTRIVTGGLAPLRGASVGEHLEDFRARLDFVRTALLS